MRLTEKRIYLLVETSGNIHYIPIECTDTQIHGEEIETQRRNRGAELILVRKNACRLGQKNRILLGMITWDISYILNNELLKELGGGNEGEEERKRNEQIEANKKLDERQRETN